MKNSDVELIQRVLEGDDDAFSMLVKKYQKQVHALAWRKIGDFHIAEEITQDTFLKAYKKLATLKEPQRFDSWLYVIAANRCSSWLRKKRLWTQPLEQLEETDDEQLQKEKYSEFVVAENERTTAEVQRDVVKKLLAKLQESERTIMTLHYFGEMTCTEIGAFLGVSKNTIKSRLRRAQQRLKKEEPMIRDALENFKISPNLTENIMQEIARIKPAAPSGGKPFMPWAIAASTVAVVLLILGFGNHQYAIRFQQPYNLEAASEMTVELIEAPLVLNRTSKPDVRTQIGSTNTQGRSNTSNQQRANTAALVTEAHADEVVEDYSQWHLPKEAKARLGKGSINVIQFSPDGTQIAVGSNIGVWLYDVETGKEIAMFPGMCQSIAFSPDGRFIASGGSRSTGGGRFRVKELQLWEITTNHRVPLTDDFPHAAALRFSEDGKTLLSLGNWGDSIGRLDVETGQGNVKNIKERSWEVIKRRSTPEPYALTHDKFAVGGQNGKIELWDTTTGKKLSTLSGHGGEIQDGKFVGDGSNHVLDLEFSPDSTLLASGSKDKTVRLWDTTTGDELAILREHTDWTNVLAFSPNGKRLASGSTDKTVRLWDTATGELLSTLTGHLNSIAALAFSPDGSTLASGSADGTIRFWNIETGDLLPLHIIGHTQWVKAVSFFKDSSTLASVAFNGVITLWDMKTSQKTGLQTSGSRDLLSTLAFSPDGTKLVSLGVKKGSICFEVGSGRAISTYESDPLIRLTDVSTGGELANLTNINLVGAKGMVLSPDGKTVAFGGSGKIHLWNTETGSSLNISPLDGNVIHKKPNQVKGKRALEFPQGMMFHNMVEISALGFSPDGKKLVSGTMGGRVQVWNAETGTELAPFFAGQDDAVKTEPGKISATYHDVITAVAFSPNGTLLAVGSYKRIRVLGSHKKTRLKEVVLRGVETLVFSPDSTVLLTGLRTGAINLWNLTTGNKLTTLDGHAGAVGTLVFSPDGKTLVSTGEDGTILIWNWEEAIKDMPTPAE